MDFVDSANPPEQHSLGRVLLMIGQTISHYTILSKLGEGGMGIVYRAHDIKLDRDVALKFLPPQFGSTPEDKARFIQEAKAASALNHPNVCTVHDIQEHEEQMFMVMEFVDGQTLRNLIEGSPEKRLPLRRAIDFGVQIADGLAAAHEKGIVHRDVKPENIMIRKDGIAQVMDFGLAKLRNSTSRVTRLTKAGSTVGTAGYMSPEQIQGQDADHRSDIFSLGVLLYELFTGELPFKGVHETALAYEIVNVDPAPMTSLVPALDPSLDAIVLECLEKDPRERTQSVAQVALDLKRYRRESSRQHVSRISAARPGFVNPPPNPLGQTGPSPVHPQLSGRQNTTVIPWAIAGIAVIGLIVSVYMLLGRSSGPGQKISAYILPPPSMIFSSQSASAGEGQFSISPDGTKLVFMATDSGGRTHMFVRPVGGLNAVQIPGTESASYPFWSPDSRWIGFFQNGKLKKIEATGGPSVTIADAEDGRGGSWGSDGTIVFSPNYISPISSVAEGGGPVTAGITKFDTSHHEQSHRWPHFLPDGKNYLYFARASFGGVERDEDAVCVASLDGKVNKRLLPVKGNAEYSNGCLVFLRESTLMAQAFNPDKLEFSGDPIPVAENVEFDLNYNKAIYSVSRNGILVYQNSTESSTVRIQEVDSNGTVLTTIGDPGQYGYWALSPDAKFAAWDDYDAQSHNRDIWLYDLARRLKTRFTFDPGVDENPVWSPDGSRIAFHSDRRGHYDLYQKTTSGAGNEELLFESPDVKTPFDWTSDGRYLLFTSVDKTTKTDIWILTMTGDRTPAKFMTTPFDEDLPIVSPDMKWLAYRSNESGHYELYVRPFLGADGKPGFNEVRKWQVSTNGIASQSLQHWSRDGKRLYYVSGDNRFLAADVVEDGASLSIGNNRQVVTFPTNAPHYFIDITPDTKRFFIIVPVATQASSPLTVVVNWADDLKKK
jgi:eukaryotic-like serine/threonine-protein kinase